MTIHEICEKRAAKVAEMRILLNTVETEKRSLNDNEKSAFDKVKAEITNLKADEQRAAFIKQTERGQPADKSLAKVEKRVTLLDAINAQVENRGLSGALAEFNQEMAWKGVSATRGGVLVPSSIFEARTTQTTTTQTKIVPDDSVRTSRHCSLYLIDI